MLYFSSVGRGSGRFAPDATSQIPPNRSRKRSPCPALVSLGPIFVHKRRHRANRVRRRSRRPAQLRQLPAGQRLPARTCGGKCRPHSRGGGLHVASPRPARPAIPAPREPGDGGTTMTALATTSSGYPTTAVSSIDRAIRLSTTAAVIAVAAIAAYVSYWHAYAVIRAHGEGGITARLEPATIDGLVYASSMVILYAARHRVPVPGLAGALERWVGTERTPIAWCLEGLVLVALGLTPRAGGWLRLWGS